MLANTNPSLLIFLILMAAMPGGSALYVLLDLIVHVILWLFLVPVVNEVQPVEIQLETCGEISL